MKVTERYVAAVSEYVPERIRQKLENQAREVTRLQNNLDAAERQVRDLARENDRLRKDIAALKSGGVL